MSQAFQAERVARLTEAQREVLRRWHSRQSAKEIGRALGITHFAVNERLRSARRVLDVATSAEAARILAAHEGEGTYKRIVCDPEGIADEGPQVIVSGPHEDGEWPSRTSREYGAVREEAVPYRATADMSRPRLPLPRYPGDRNDLTTGTRLMWIGIIALGIVMAVGALITISWGVVRMVRQLLRAFA